MAPPAASRPHHASFHISTHPHAPPQRIAPPRAAAAFLLRARQNAGMSSQQPATGARVHFASEFTKSKQAGIDYLYGGELKRMRAPAAPVSVTNPPATNDNPRRSRAEVKDRPQDNKEQQWPVRGLKKVESAPKDNVERTLFQRRTLIKPAVIPQDNQQKSFMGGGKAMVGGRSHHSSGNIISWGADF